MTLQALCFVWHNALLSIVGWLSRMCNKGSLGCFWHLFCLLPVHLNHVENNKRVEKTDVSRLMPGVGGGGV